MLIASVSNPLLYYLWWGYVCVICRGVRLNNGPNLSLSRGAFIYCPGGGGGGGGGVTFAIIVICRR